MSRTLKTPMGSNDELPVAAGRSMVRNNRDAIEQSSDNSSLLNLDTQKPKPQASEEALQQQHAEHSETTKTTLVVLGSYLIAWALAIAHCVFFRLLNGKEVSSFSILRQSRVSLVSLLLVTAFRAAIIVVLGTCFTQHLWYILRKRCLRVDLIDELFQIRSNFLGLANMNIILQAPLLFLAAILTWLVPLATVYPPGALTVQSEMHTSFDTVNSSVMNPKMPVQDFMWENLSSSRFPSLAGMSKASGFSYTYDESHNRIPELTRGHETFTYGGPRAALRSLSKFVVSSGQIVVLQPLLGENSSYTLSFEGPRLQCKNSTDIEIIQHLDTRRGWLDLVVFNSTWSDGPPVHEHPIFTVTQIEPQGFYYDNTKAPPEVCFNDECTIKVRNLTAMMVFERQTMRCYAHTAIYQASVNYVRGVQNISYTLKDDEPFEFSYTNEFQYNATEYSGNVNETQGYKDWAAMLPTWYQKASSCTILDSIGQVLGYQWRMSIEVGSRSHTTLKPYKLPNGTEIELDEIQASSRDEAYNNFTRLEDSALNRYRFTETFSSYSNFDPRRTLNITEESLNDILANITISALSLNTWYGNVTVTDTQYRNVYRFSDLLEFYLPYGLCLGLTLIFIALGLYALRQNGTAATDGGFLQLMMTTRGDTVMSQEVKTGSIGGKENAPQALLDMKVRFGELISDGETSAVRYGFGTMEETLSLRRKR